MSIIKSPSFSAIFANEDSFCDFLFVFLGHCSPIKIGSSLKGNNLLLGEQILYFKS